MTNEEFQSLILSEFKSLKSDISGMKYETTEIKADVSGVKSEITEMKFDISGIKGQLDKNTQIIHAIRHHQEVANAKLEGFELTTAKADKVELLDTKCDILNTRLFTQEAQSAQLLKRIK